MKRKLYYLIAAFVLQLFACLPAQGQSEPYINITSKFIKNYNFNNGNVDGWEHTNAPMNGYMGSTYTNGSITVSKFIELWTGSGSNGLGNGYIRQQIKDLPVGKYRLEADIIATRQYISPANGATGAYLYANNERTSIATDYGIPQHFTVDFTIDETSSIYIGIILENTDANWVAADNFKLLYSGTEEIEINTPSIICEDGTYYIKNNESGQFLQNGAYWGARAVLGYDGIPYTISLQDGEQSLYTLVSNVNGPGSGTALRPSDGFNDQSGAWELVATEGGFYMYNGSTYFSYDGTGIPQFVSKPTSASVWNVMTEEQRTAAVVEAMANASEENPVDVSFFIKQADFMMHDPRPVAWEGGENIGGASDSGCTLPNSGNSEKWNVGTFDFKQTITGLPSGYYTLTVKAFYRHGSSLLQQAADAYENRTEISPVLYAGNMETPIKSIFENDIQTNDVTGFSTMVTSSSGKKYYIANNQSNADYCFNGDIYLNTLTGILVGNDETLTIGIRRTGEAVGDWTAFDQFHLYYYGTGKEQPVKTPVIKYESSKVTISCATTGADIYYTTDGSTPTTASTRYTESFTLTTPCTIKAIGIKGGLNNSEVATYELKECAVPTIASSGNTVTISCVTNGAVIRYTTDGTEPNAASSIYTAPITVNRNIVIKAYATCEGYIDSKASSHTIESFKVAVPAITYAGKTLTITCGTKDAIIYYTTDGTTPTTASIRYTAPFTMTTPCTIRAIGIMEGYNSSEISTYELKECAAPAFSVSSNTVSITCATIGAVIRYTTDGTEPNSTSRIYTAPITVERNLTIKAYAVCEGCIDSKTNSYTIESFKVEIPAITYTNKTLTITCGTTGANIYYTTDGSIPTAASTRYRAPITMTTPCTVKAIGIMEGYNSSEVVTYELKECAAPTITSSGSTVTISCATAGAVIRYTTDGTEPNAASSIYTVPITVDRNLTVKAYATCEGLIDSKTTSHTIGAFTVNVPAITYTNKTLTIACGTIGASIYYTTDGSSPTTASTRYTAPITMTTPCTVKAIGMMDGYNSSETATYELKECAAPTFTADGSTVTISCATAGAVIRYTTDGTEPNPASSIYTAPITVNRNLTVKAYATCEGLIDSKTSSHTVGLFSVATPSISYSGRNVSITCGTEGASIYYTLDGSTPTTASERYTDSFTMESPCTINAIGIMEGYNNSEVATYELMECAAPTFAAGSTTLSIYCETLGAVIRYTTDGTEPDETSTMYSTPIDIDRNLTVKAYATRNGYIDSQTSTYEVNSFAVATPVIAYSDGKVTITCGTIGASIYYTLDGSTPTNTSDRYTAAFTMESPCTIKAIGMMDGHSDSEVATYELKECDAPAFAVDGSTVTISCATAGAVIRYTTDGTEPDMASTIYTAPVTVDHNLTIKAYATLDGYIDSKTSTYTFGLFAVATPVIAFSDKTVDMSCATAGAAIYYTMDGSTPTSASARFAKPFTADKPCTIKAIGMMEGHNPSEVATFTLDACRPVTFSYDGRYVSISSPDGATIYYTTDGSEPTTSSAKYAAPFDAGYMATIKGMADTRDSLSSETTSFTTEYHYNGYVAKVGKAGCLDKAFGWCGTDTVISLTVEGRLNAEDITTLAAMPALRHLDMAKVDMTGEAIANKSFAGSGLVSVSLPASLGSIGSNVFEGCRDMASITWNVDGVLPATAIDGIDNPNLLIYVRISTYVPKKTNVVAGGTAAEVVLSDVADGGNFYCPQEFIAEKISYTHNYGMKTYIGKGAGWETLALPFDVQDITHETKGEMAPFAAGRETAKPFWLYGFSTGGFERADEIKAYTPYIICMPNADDYADSYNLAGNVTFSATKARVAVTRPNPSTNGTLTLMPTTMAVQKSNNVCPINRNTEYNGFLPGEAFLANLRDVTPFEAYIVINSNASKQNAFRIQDGIMGNYDDIEGIMASGMRIYSSNHVLYIDTDVERSASIYSMNGTLIKTVTLSAGHNTINGLADGCYIVERRKVIVQ